MLAALRARFFSTSFATSLAAVTLAGVVIVLVSTASRCRRLNGCYDASAAGSAAASGSSPAGPLGSASAAGR